MKLQNSFHFAHPLRKTVRVNGKKESVPVALLIVSGHYGVNRNETDPNERYPFEIDTIQLEGQDIMPVLEHLDALDVISGAALEHIAGLCRGGNVPDEDVRYGVSMICSPVNEPAL